jgi:hypothetical protein
MRHKGIDEKYFYRPSPVNSLRRTLVSAGRKQKSLVFVNDA